MTALNALSFSFHLHTTRNSWLKHLNTLPPTKHLHFLSPINLHFYLCTPDFSHLIELDAPVLSNTNTNAVDNRIISSVGSVVVHIGRPGASF